MNTNPRPLYHPPPNEAGVLLPPDPNDPPIYRDFFHAQEYEDKLKWSRQSKHESCLLRILILYVRPTRHRRNYR